MMGSKAYPGYAGAASTDKPIDRVFRYRSLHWWTYCPYDGCDYYDKHNLQVVAILTLADHIHTKHNPTRTEQLTFTFGENGG